MTLSELGIGTAASIGIGAPVTIAGVRSRSKPLTAIGAAIMVAPITYVGVLIAADMVGEIREKASKKKNTSSSDEA